MGSRKWWRSHFVDHPLYRKNQSKESRPDEVWANAKKDKIRVFCKYCLEIKVGHIIQQEEEQVRTSGGDFFPRTHEAIVLSLFSVDPQAASREWFEARSETLVVHLRHCAFTPADVKERALQEAAESTPRAQRTYHMSTTDIVSPRPLYPSQQSEASLISEWQTRGQLQIQARPPSAASTQQIQRMDTPGNYGQSSAFNPFDSSSRMGPSPAPTMNSISSSSIYSATSANSFHRNKLQRTASGLKRPLSSAGASPISQALVVWSAQQQKDFEDAIARLTASAGLAFNWVSNPEFLKFCQDFIPQAKVPSRKVLSNRILPTMLRDIRTRIQNNIRGQLVTIQCDGWTGANGVHLNAFMVTAGKKVYTVTVMDTTTERKTAEHLLSQMLEVIRRLRDEWGVIVVAFTTDASGESRKARRLLLQQEPTLVAPDCYAHQVNLIVGDYFKTKGSGFLQYSSQANELISWLRSKTQILGLIKDALVRRGRNPLSVIRPVPTRWTAYYLAYRRLLDLRDTLEYIVVDDANKQPSDRQIIPVGGDRTTREKATKMVEIIKTPVFWHSLARIKHHLAPLAIAANITQSAHCRLDEVLLTFGSLALEYAKLTDAMDKEVKDALLSSIERRWEKSDQDVFIAAVILNPYVKITPFRKNAHVISQGAIHALLSRLWTRFYSEPCPDELYEEIRDYTRGTGETFTTLKNACERLSKLATSRKQSPDPIQAYLDVSVEGEEPGTLIKLALRILSICPNSASCERLFSTFGLILTKLRTRLGVQKVVDLAECKMHIRDENMEAEAKAKLRTRLFGINPESNTTSTLAPTASQASGAPSLSTQEAMDTQPDNSVPTSDSSTTPDDSLGAPNLSTTRSLRTLTSHLINMLDNDNDMDLEGSEDNDYQHMVKRPIQDLFNFSLDQWVASAMRSAVGNLEQEMEFYDLLDQDAAGDIDLDYDIDDCVESIFSN